MPDFWKSKRVLVTGGQGFLGTHLSVELERLGAEVYRAPRLAHNLMSVDATRILFATVRPDLVFHLAAVVGGIGANKKRPGDFFYENMLMGLNVLHEAKEHAQRSLAGLEKLVFVSTVCSYPRDCPVPFREQDLWAGYPEETNAPYGIAKKALMVMCQAYRQQHNMRFITLIPTNLYGPGDSFDLQTSHVIPAMIRRMEHARQDQGSIHLWGTGQASREFLYVADAVWGLLLAAEHYDEPEPVNLGTGREIRIEALASRIAQLVGYKGLIGWDEHMPDGQPRRCLDVSRARECFGFQAEMGLGQGLQETIDWWRGQNGKE